MQTYGEIYTDCKYLIVNSWAMATHESHEHLSPTNNDDFTVYHIIELNEFLQ